MKNITCIIPAYNEAPRISRVLDVVLAHPDIDEVCVVNDGSRDDTKQVVSAYKESHLRLISHPVNRGKSVAVATGITETDSEFILLLDADLEGLTEIDITNLLTPVLSNSVDVSISLRKNVPYHYRMLGIDFISGERFFTRSMIAPYVATLATLRPFGIEVFINKILIEKNLSIAIVTWLQVRSPYKYWKEGFWKGLKGDVRMVQDILTVIPVRDILRQILVMRFVLMGKKKVINEFPYDISVVVPAYNEEKYIFKCLQAIEANIASSVLKVEIIVIDNASTDKTAEIATQFPSVRVVREDKKGLTYARERGLRFAQAPIVAYVDADTIMPSAWIERVNAQFKQKPNLVCLSGPFYFYDISQLLSIGVWVFWTIFAYPAYLLVGYMATGPNFAISKKATESIGGFDTSIAFFGEDTDIARRLSKVGDVHFLLSFTMQTSGRRLSEEGVFFTLFRYIVNFFSVAFAKKAVTHAYNDIR